jgi:uroporphyrinogen III methyltransferase/synthase
VTGTLEDIVAKAEATSIRPPAIAVIGDVVRLRDTIRWYDNKPLFGQRILVTRTREQASELSRALSAAGAEAIELPALKITRRYDEAQLTRAIEALRDGNYAWVCFTSSNAVSILFDFLGSRSLDARAVRARVAAIGPGTANSLRACGIEPDLVPDAYTAEGLAAAFEGIGVAGVRVLLPRAENAREVLVDALTARGAAVDEVSLYVAEVPDPELVEGPVLARLRAGEIDIATFASSSTVKNLVGLLGGDVEPLRRCRIACIGPVTAATAEGLLGRPPDVIASEHTIEGLVRAIIASPG